MTGTWRIPSLGRMLSPGRPLSLLLLAVLVAVVWLPEVPGLRFLRLACFDTYQSLAPRVRRSDSVVIVAIDDESLRRLGQWPWPRTRLARLVSRISEARPAAIGLDILMPEPDRLSPGRLGDDLIEGLDPALAQKLGALASNDTVLARALRGRPVVLGVAGADGDATPGAIGTGPVRAFGADPVPFLSRFSTGVGSVPEIDGAAMGRGLVSVDAERGVVRRVPLVAVVGGTVMPTLALEMLRVAARVPAVTVRVGARGIQAVVVGDLLVPTEPDGRVWLHYSHHDPARFVSAGDVLAGLVEPGRFQGRLVLIGANALGLSDAQGTPVADQMSGVEIHAQLLEGLIEGSLLSRPATAHWIELGLVVLVGVAMLYVFDQAPVWVTVMTALTLLIALASVAVGFYLRRGLLLDPVPAIVAVLVLLGQQSLVKLNRLARLKRFFSPQLAELIVEGGAADPLASHRREVTVVFLDLRGFTAFADTTEPEAVMGVLHEYQAEGRWDYAAIGTVTNLAARLCAEARSEQVLVSQGLAETVREFASLEALGPLALKGFGRPLPVFNVLTLTS
jgi:adenylate cyclase